MYEYINYLLILLFIFIDCSLSKLSTVHSLLEKFTNTIIDDLLHITLKFYQKNKHVEYFLKEMTEVISLKDAFKILDVYSYNLTCRMICEQFGEQTWFQSIDLYIAENHVKCAGDNSVNSCMKSQQVWIAKQIIYFWSVMKVAQQFVIRI